MRLASGKILACMVLLWAACAPRGSAAEQESAEAPGITRIESNVPVAPPGWAALERRLIDVLSRAALDYTARYTRSGGTLIWKTSGGASLDDLPESFYNLPLLYALGGDARLREVSFREWNATTRQLTYDFGVLHHEFAKQGDWFHLGEGMLYFYFLGLADPTDHENVARAKRFAGLYLNEEPEAPNYDAKLRLIRSPHTGSLGPAFGDPQKAAPYGWSKGMATYGLPLEDLPGIRSMEDLKDPENARRMGRAMAERMLRGDVPANLSATALVANAYLYTGERKYAEWVKNYVEAWIERTRQNGGITPDNIGLSGKAGEYQNGKWWGGQYGWHWPHGYYSIGMALQIGGATAMLVSGGDAHYLELPRSNMDHLIALGKTVNGAFLVPYKKGDRGWYAFQPIDRSLPASLWYLSQSPADWQRLETLRLASTQDWNIATQSPYPNRGYASLPEPREDCWNCDVEGLADWNKVANIRNKEDRSHEGPWLRFLAGANPDYPEKILRESYGQAAWKLDQIRRNVLLLEYDPRGTEKIDPAEATLTHVHEHHWQTINPVTTEALVQLTLGAPQIMYNGGLLHATVRYFDPARRRPGLPPDVAALVTRVEANRAVLELINLSPFETREVIVQGGAFGEHQFTRVKYQVRTDPEPLQPDHFARPAFTLAERSVDVNRKFFAVRLAPGTGLTLELGMRRFANRPSYAFPWHGDAIPIE
ncbi:MAG TPA: hypothetical protein VFA33_03230 [Bryobacteraceae bacterium]|nr:hypothetical protein [Bryobacteraceae bacterium]